MQSLTAGEGSRMHITILLHPLFKSTELYDCGMHSHGTCIVVAEKCGTLRLVWTVTNESMTFSWYHQSTASWPHLTSSLRFCQRPQGLSSRMSNSSSLSSSSSVAVAAGGWMEAAGKETDAALSTCWILLDVFTAGSSSDLLLPSVPGAPVACASNIMTQLVCLPAFLP